MRPASSGAACGVVIGISAVLLLQQLAWISLSDPITGITYLLVAALAAGVVFGVGGWLLGRSAMKRALSMLAAEEIPGASGGPPIESDAKPAATDPPTDSADAPKSS
jgi:hypothetical protein